MPPMQLQIDFIGKKDQRITFAADDDLTAMLKSVAKDLGRDNISDLVREYAIECVTRDKGKIMLMKSRGEKKFAFMA